VGLYIILGGEGDGLWVGITSSVRWSEGRRTVARIGHGTLLESLGRRMDLLILWTDLGQQQRPVLSDLRPCRSGQLSVDRVR